MMKTYCFLFLLYIYYQVNFATRMDMVNHIINSGQAVFTKFQWIEGYHNL